MSEFLRLEFHQATNRGWVREKNEDCAGVILPEDAAARLHSGSLFAIADGLGGQPDGEVASREAVNFFESIEKTHIHFKTSDEVEKIFHNVNDQIYFLNKTKPSFLRMGTTLTVSFFHQEKVSIGHVGDCRLYRIRDLGIHCLTTDHSSERNVLLRAVGLEKKVEVDYYEHSIKPGDIYVQCSDGLHGVVTDFEIFRQVMPGDPQTSCVNLMDLAMRRGGPDNITIQVIQIS